MALSMPPSPADALPPVAHAATAASVCTASHTRSQNNYRAEHAKEKPRYRSVEQADASWPIESTTMYEAPRRINHFSPVIPPTVWSTKAEKKSKKMAAGIDLPRHLLRSIENALGRRKQNHRIYITRYISL